MKKDLSQELHTTTALFEEILPEIIAIRDSTDDESTKKENAVNFIVARLCKERNEDPNEVKGISRECITKVRNIIARKETIDGIINYINSSIKSGKNYNGGN